MDNDKANTVGQPAQPQSKARIAAALAKAQGAFEKVEKNRTATVPMKSGGKYSYKYADLADVMAACRKALLENSLALVQGIEFDDVSRRGELVTTLWHESGEYLVSRIPLVEAQGSGPQALGSTLTYLRRYGACALLGIVAEEDDDAELAEKEAAANRRAAPQQRPAPQGRPQPPRQQQRPAATPPTAPISEAQIRRIYAMAKEAGFSEEAHLKDLLYSMFGDAMLNEKGQPSMKALTSHMAQEVFKALDAEIKARKARK